MPYFNFFGGPKFEKTIVIFEISLLEIALLESLVQKYKSLNLGSKMSALGISLLAFQNSIVIFEIGLVQKRRNLGPKMPDLVIFVIKFECNIVIFGISTFEFV